MFPEWAVDCVAKETDRIDHNSALDKLFPKNEAEEIYVSRAVVELFKENRHLGASFFFKRGEPGRWNDTKLFPTFIRQLMRVLPELIAVVRKTLQDDPDIAFKSLKEQFHKLLLQSPLSLNQLDQQPPTVVIVIDALDECEDGKNHLASGISDPSARDITLFLKTRLSKTRPAQALSPGWPGYNAVQALVTSSVPYFSAAVRPADVLISDSNRLLNIDSESPDEEIEVNTNRSMCDDSDIESIFSTGSTSSSQSSQSESTPIAISKLANLLMNDRELTLLYPIAISRVGPVRFQTQRKLDKFERSILSIISIYSA
ncbi:hypothetical protein EMCG_09273 [[Emmonsia] crescens]|uniref:Nephrocystin 3-like N-terminal domain-containing protein n=1 Tax=[Emmonsia] crescens TaxID=73230 RepID=A0A0G2J9Z2_9EURO|nr:hypothetical protein EMCG_09273 [Emmonsia crescens UAMH 3008]